MLGEAPIEHVDAAALWTFIRLAHPFEAAGRDEIADLPFAQPADNLLLGGYDPYESARTLQGKVVHAQAQDARQAGPNRTGQLVPLGHGDIEWMRFLSVLEEIEYRGWLVVDQETGDNRVRDVAAGVQFLRRFMGQETP